MAGKNTFDIFKTDRTKEQQGVEFRVTETDPTGKDDFYIRVRRLGNPEYHAALQQVAVTKGRRMRHAGVDVAAMDKMSIEIMARHILVGWRGFHENGVEVPYSPAKAEELLANADFRRLVEDVASDMQMFRDQELGAAEGN